MIPTFFFFFLRKKHMNMLLREHFKKLEVGITSVRSLSRRLLGFTIISPHETRKMSF